MPVEFTLATRVKSIAAPHASASTSTGSPSSAAASERPLTGTPEIEEYCKSMTKPEKPLPLRLLKNVCIFILDLYIYQYDIGAAV